MTNLRIVISLATVLLATAVAAQQNDYGGYDVVKTGRITETEYAGVRGWQVVSAVAGGKFAYCVATADRGDGIFTRIGWDGQQWQVAVPFKSKPNWEGDLKIDEQGAGRGYKSGGSFISGTAAAGWTIAWLGEAELDALRKGQRAVLSVGKFDYDFPLTGAAAMITKVQECVQRSGKSTSAASTPTSTPSEASLSSFGKAGSWIVNSLTDGKRIVACEAYDTAKNNLRFEIDKENAYVDVNDGGSMGNLHERKTLKVAFGPGSTPSLAEAEIIEGRDGGKWARITEARADGPGMLDDAIPNATQVSFTGDNIVLETGLEGSNKALDIFFKCMSKMDSAK